jgi:TonB family protein
VTLLVLALLAAQTVPECWAFGLTAYPPGRTVFPAVRLAPDGRALLDRATGEATWTRDADSVSVASGSGYQGWRLVLRPGAAVPTATLRRWEDDPHASPEPPIDFRARPIACESVEWPTGVPGYDELPRLQNAMELDGAMRRNRAGAPFGVRRSTKVMVRVDEAGAVAEVRLEQTSGVAELDDVALETADVARFSPATRGGQPVAAWTALFFRFR